MRVNNKERAGIYEVGLTVEQELGWIFREQPIVDVGIDALIEEATNGNPTGRFIATQIKSGGGNFSVKQSSYTYYATNIHFYYWINLTIPIILIARISPGKIYWQNLIEDNFTKTKKKWKIEIPKNKSLKKKSISDLSEVISKHQVKFQITSNNYSDVSEEMISKLQGQTEMLSEGNKSLEKISKLIEDLGTEAISLTEKINDFGGMRPTNYTSGFSNLT